MADRDRLHVYEAKLLELCETLTRTLGAPTVDVLLQRSLAEVSRAYPELLLIRRSARALDFDELNAAYADEPEEKVQRAFSALYAVMVVVLGRMLGKEIALRLAESPDAYTVLEGRLIGTN